MRAGPAFVQPKIFALDPKPRSLQLTEVGKLCEPMLNEFAALGSIVTGSIAFGANCSDSTHPMRVKQAWINICMMLAFLFPALMLMADCRYWNSRA